MKKIKVDTVQEEGARALVTGTDVHLHDTDSAETGVCTGCDARVALHVPVENGRTMQAQLAAGHDVILEIPENREERRRAH